MVKREVCDWGIRLVVKPFASKPLEIRAEVTLPKGSKGSDVRVSFGGVTFADPLRLIEAQTWAEAMTALLTESRSVVSEMREARNRDNQTRRKS